VEFCVRKNLPQRHRDTESRKDKEKEKDSTQRTQGEGARGHRGRKDFNAEGAETQNSLRREYERKELTEEA
jgi:hypothetical protein